MPLHEETETLTIRLPKGLKGLVEQTAKMRSTSVTAVVRESLQNAFKPIGTIIQTPGMTAAFDEFIDENDEKGHGRQEVLLLVTDSRGQRYFFSGHIDRTFTNPSLVTIVSGKRDWVIPRQEIVGWFGGNRHDLRTLSVMLQREGWAPR